MESFIPVLPGLGLWREGAVYALKQRNAFADALFYDVDALTLEERYWLVANTLREGSLLVVEPSPGDNRIAITPFETPEAYLDADGPRPRRITLTGVGSSDLGAAALARDVANYYQEPVTAIVSGYGMADLMTEALGGWFVLGMTNRVLDLLNGFDERTAETEARYARVLPKGGARAAAFVHGSPDSDTLLYLLLQQPGGIELLLGHSKGCLSISNALFGLVAAGHAPALKRARQATIVTTGAVVELPARFDHVHQFIGEYDWLGAINSRWDEPSEALSGAWHHTNPALPFALSVAAVLERIVPRRARPPERPVAE